MRPVRLITAGILMLALVGCVSDRPESIEREERAISSVVALLVGYESDGLTSLIADLVDDSLTAAGEAPLVRPASFIEPSPGRTFVRSRRGASALGESRTRCEIRPADATTPGAGEGVSIDIDGQSLHASNDVSIRAESRGTIVLADAGPLLDRFASGELRIDGGLGDRPSDGIPFTHIEATLSWTHLRIGESEPGETPAMEGAIAISIAARGPGGLIIRNGILELDGDDDATLDLTGRRYRIDLRRARVLR